MRSSLPVVKSHDTIVVPVYSRENRCLNIGDIVVTTEPDKYDQHQVEGRIVEYFPTLSTQLFPAFKVAIGHSVALWRFDRAGSVRVLDSTPKPRDDKNISKTT